MTVFRMGDQPKKIARRAWAPRRYTVPKYPEPGLWLDGMPHGAMFNGAAFQSARPSAASGLRSKVGACRGGPFPLIA
jgi:hypothetical protein